MKQEASSFRAEWMSRTKYVFAQRYETEADARKGHEEVIKNLAEGKKYDGEDPFFNEIIENKDITKMLKCILKVSETRHERHQTN